jgi:hypothetical protein
MDFQTKHQIFSLWLGIVYFNRMMPPARPSPVPLELEFERDYEDGAWRELGRGLTLEETCFVNECALGPCMCVINAESPSQPMERIEWKVIVRPEKMISLALEHFLWAGGMPALVVYDREFGHSIYLTKANEEGTCVLFSDPWPGRSLLCAENNAAGVKALPVAGLWQVTRDELAKVLVAFVVKSNTWQYLPSASSL